MEDDCLELYELVTVFKIAMEAMATYLHDL